MTQLKVRKVGKVSVEKPNDSSTWRIRFSTPDRRRIARSIGYGKTGYDGAVARAKKIDADLCMGTFDPTLERYGFVPRWDKQESKQQDKTPKPPSLQELWSSYKTLNTGARESSKRTMWRQVDNLLNLSDTPIYLDDLEPWYKRVLDTYAPSTIYRLLTYLVTAVNLAVQQGRVTANPLSSLKSLLPKKQKKRSGVSLIGGDAYRTRECFEREELIAIQRAFGTEDYCSHPLPAGRSHYEPFVRFLMLTGCRPGEAIALTWDDVTITPHGEGEIRIEKSYVGGYTDDTKTGVDRIFPITPQLFNLFETMKRVKSKENLVFPAPEGKHIDIRNFTQRHWKLTVNALVADGKLKRYLPTYNLRHTFITTQIRNGGDIASIAKLCGTSSEMIHKHYLSAKNDYIPTSPL